MRLPWQDERPPGVTQSCDDEHAQDRQTKACHGKNLPRKGHADLSSERMGRVSGLVRMTQINGEETQTMLRIMRSGDLLGCAAVLQKFSYPATATAVQDTVVLSWRSSQFLGLIKQHQAIMDNTLRIVATRTKEMVQRVSDMSDKSVERRIAAALLRLAAQAGTKAEGGIQILLPITRDDLAEMAGHTYFTVSRMLSVWQKQGLVKNGRQRMTILDPDRLAEIADGRKQLRLTSAIDSRNRCRKVCDYPNGEADKSARSVSVARYLEGALQAHGDLLRAPGFFDMNAAYA